MAERTRGKARALPRDPEALTWYRMLEDEYESRVAAWSDIQGQMPLLRSWARRYDAPAIAELGTRSGQSTSALLAGASATGGHVWSVDNGPVDVPSWWADTGLWSFLAADDMGGRAYQWVPERLDILFIDTSHLFEHTREELYRYVPRVRPGGVVLCHDTELAHTDPVMGEAWIRQAMGGPPFPVAAALDTFCADTGLTWERQPAPAVTAASKPFYGIGLIKIPEVKR